MVKVDVVKLSQLARIAISDQVASQLAPQLGDILEYAAQLQSVDTTNTVATSQVTGLIDVWREDEIHPAGISREELLKNAPATQNGYIKVKRVL